MTTGSPGARPEAIATSVPAMNATLTARLRATPLSATNTTASSPRPSTNAAIGTRVRLPRRPAEGEMSTRATRPEASVSPSWGAMRTSTGNRPLRGSAAAEISLTRASKLRPG